MATRKGMCYAIVEKKGTQNNMEGKAFCDGWFHRTVGFLDMNLFLILHGLPWQGEERMTIERACSLERRKVVPPSDRINTCRS